MVAAREGRFADPVRPRRMTIHVTIELAIAQHHGRPHTWTGSLALPGDRREALVAHLTAIPQFGISPTKRELD